MDEPQLISAAQRGDLAPFNRLVETYQTQVYNLALRMLGCPQAAQDATQEAFLSAFRAIKGFRGGSFKAWLLRIATNACYDQMRQRQRRPTISLDAMLATPESGMEPPSPAESPDDHTERRELSRAISDGLATLLPEQRLAVILCDVQGLSYEEAAQAMGSSLGTVKSRLSRGRAHLRQYLLQQHGELLTAKMRQYE
jgi:RNA polymerase sigma-70 factor (ECF subfamily)